MSKGRERRTVRRHNESHLASVPPGGVRVLVPYWKPEGHGVAGVLNMAADDIVGGLSERRVRILNTGHVSDGEPSKLFEFPRPLELRHHAVNLVLEFVDFFDHQYPAFCFRFCLGSH